RGVSERRGSQARVHHAQAPDVQARARRGRDDLPGERRGGVRPRRRGARTRAEGELRDDADGGSQGGDQRQRARAPPREPDRLGEARTLGGPDRRGRRPDEGHRDDARGEREVRDEGRSHLWAAVTERLTTETRRSTEGHGDFLGEQKSAFRLSFPQAFLRGPPWISVPPW